MALVMVCAIDEVPESGTVCKRLADGMQIAVARLESAQSKLVAFENRCPHVRGPIGLGKIQGSAVTCPWHFFRFDLTTGETLGMQSVMRLRIFPTLVHDRQVFIDV